MIDRTLVDVLINYGALGAITAFLAIFINRLRLEHNKERESWKATSESQFDRIADLTRNSIEAMMKLGAAITSLENKIR